MDKSSAHPAKLLRGRVANMTPPRFHIRGRWLFALLATAIVAASLFVPGEYVPTVSSHSEYGMHALAFLGLTLAWTLAWPRASLPIVLALLAGAVATEGLQATVIPLRTGALDDALANVVGVALGAALAWGLERRRARSGNA